MLCRFAVEATWIPLQIHSSYFTGVLGYGRWKGAEEGDEASAGVCGEDGASTGVCGEGDEDGVSTGGGGNEDEDTDDDDDDDCGESVGSAGGQVHST